MNNKQKIFLALAVLGMISLIMPWTEINWTHRIYTFQGYQYGWAWTTFICCAIIGGAAWIKTHYALQIVPAAILLAVNLYHIPTGVTVYGNYISGTSQNIHVCIGMYLADMVALAVIGLAIYYIVEEKKI
jgi:hypothetical protein